MWDQICTSTAANFLKLPNDTPCRKRNNLETKKKLSSSSREKHGKKFELQWQ